MIVYKVVDKVSEGKFASCVIENPNIRITYQIGVLAKPRVPGTPIFAFRDVDRALSFKASSQLILECEAEEEFKSKNKYFDSSGMILTPDNLDNYGNNRPTTMLKNFWNYRGKLVKMLDDNEFHWGYFRTVPPGTILVTSLTPIRIMERE